MTPSDKRIILVTGANGGLGQAIARSFLKENSVNHLALGIHRNREHAESLSAEFPNRTTLIQLDATSRDVWKTAVEQLLETHGRIDVLINNAGTHDDRLLAQMDDSVWHSVTAANLDSVYYGCHAVLPAMIGQRHGRIVNVSSLSALLAPAGQANYAAAKAGVLALTSSLAKEVARIGITVNAVCPGYIETEALASLSAEDRKAACMKIPMRRLGRPEEVAAAVRFLACAEAGYITGSALKIDGGIL